MILRTIRPSELTPSERSEFITFVGNAGEVNLGTLPALVSRAGALITIADGQNLIGTAAIKRPTEDHRRGEFSKAKVVELADAYPFELGWVVVDENHRRCGLGRRLVAEAIASSPGFGVFATTKSDQMRRMLVEFGFAALGQPYRSVLNPEAKLTLFGRPA